MYTNRDLIFDFFDPTFYIALNLFYLFIFFIVKAIFIFLIMQIK